MIELKKEITGKILDIGGGGEGVIGQLYGAQVVAIDKYKEELDEAPDGFEKILMDATDMAFPDCSFDSATFFYTLMYMNEKEQKKSILEAARVVKPGGEIRIWDCNISSAFPVPFCIDVEIMLPKRKICTTYGIGKLKGQSFEGIKSMCENIGLKIEATEFDGTNFYIKCKKKVK